MVGIATEVGGPGFDILIDGFASLNAGKDHKDQLAPASREIATPVALSGLNDHGIALRGSRHGERPLRLIPLPLVVQPRHFIGIGKVALGSVEDEGIIFPCVPQAIGHFEKLVGYVVAGIVLHMPLQPIVLGLGIH